MNIMWCHINKKNPNSTRDNEVDKLQEYLNGNNADGDGKKSEEVGDITG